MNKQLVQSFIDPINEHNVDKFCSLMTENNKCIDPHGNEDTGEEQMRAGWPDYFKLFHEYKIEVTDVYTYDE